MMKYLDLHKINALHETEIRKAISDVIDSGWYLKGKATEAFEKQYAEFCETSHCVACGNGLDALHLIFRAYKELGKLRDGDEVIVPAITFIATMAYPLSIGCKLVFADVDEHLNMDPEDVARKITPNTKAIIPVSLGGVPCDYARLFEIVEKKKYLKEMTYILW